MTPRRCRSAVAVAVTAALAVALTGGAAVLPALALSASADAARPETACDCAADDVIAPAAPSEPAPAPAPVAEPPAPPAPPPVPPGGDAMLAFQLDGTSYAALALVGESTADSDDDPTDRDATRADPISNIPAAPRIPRPRHGAPRYIGDADYPEAAIAEVEPADLPPHVAAWHGRRVVVDAACEATVTGFALVARVSGSFDYMLDDTAGATAADRARAVLDNGVPVVAAVLSGCATERGVARAAELPPALSVIAVADAELARIATDKAKQALAASPAASEAQARYEEAGGAGSFWNAEYADGTTTVFRHPVTGAVMVSMQVIVDYECGGASINLWGVFEVDVDATGEAAVSTIRAGDAGAVVSIERAMVVRGADGDELVFLASEYLSGPVLVTARGATVRSLPIPFFGCPC